MTKITFLADVHYYSKSLGTSGRAYDFRSGSDQKCLAETEEIVDAAFSKLRLSNTNAIFIAGDITNDGEKASHEEFRNKINLLSKDKPVYLITSTHDWCCDKNPRCFNGDTVSNEVETLKSEELRDYYYEFGPKQAIAEYITHLGTASYVIQVSEDVRVLALNDDQNGKGKAGYTEEHLEWVCEQIRKAKEENQILIGMQHHLLMPHISELISKEQCIGDNEEVTRKLVEAGLQVMVVGHSHFHNTKRYISENGNILYEINVGSLCGYPSPIVHMTIENNEIIVSTEHVEKFYFDGNQRNIAYLKEHVDGLIMNLINSAARGDKKEFIDWLNALSINGERYIKVFFIIKKLAKYIKVATLANLCRKLNYITFGRAVDKKLISKLHGYKLIDIIKEILYSTMDGSIKAYKKSDEYYKGIMAVVSVPMKFSKKPIFKQIVDSIDVILTGGEINSNLFTISYTKDLIN